MTHLDRRGAARMVDVSQKPATVREAVACGRIRMSAAARRALAAGAAKGDALAVARVAAIAAAKKTADLIPLCHSLPLSQVEVDFRPRRGGIECAARVKTAASTGVEMEALTAVHVGLLTIYDMLKSVDRAMVVEEIRLLEKRGGESGDYKAR